MYFSEKPPEPKVDILAENLTEREQFLRSIGFKECDLYSDHYSFGIVGIIFTLMPVIIILVLDFPKLREQINTLLKRNVRSYRDYIRGK